MHNLFLTLILFVLFLSFTACNKQTSIVYKIQPVTIEAHGKDHLPNLKFSVAAEVRLGIESFTFTIDPSGKRTIPLSAIIYDTNGSAWIFTNPSSQTYRREPVRVLQTIENQVRIESSIPNNVPIVTQGVVELFGIESGIGK